MYKLTIDSDKLLRRVRACDMKIGDVGQIAKTTNTNQTYWSDIVLCAYGCIVSLNDPRKTWCVSTLDNKIGDPQFMVQLLNIGQEVTLKINGKK